MQKILLSSQSYEDDTSNVGFVPLLNLVLDWGFGSKMGLLFEVDALAAPGGQGRAEDVSLSFLPQPGEKTPASEWATDLLKEVQMWRKCIILHS